MSKTITVYYFDYCASNIGIWSREFFGSEAEANKARQTRLEAGYETPEELTGQLDEMTEIYTMTVPLTPDGVVVALSNGDPNI